jgi:RNA polymerase sigma factor (sigma-70 family)
MELGRAETDDRAIVGSFDEFYKAEYRPLVGLAYVLCGDRWAAEDLAQDAFLAARRNWADVSQLDSPEGWVRKVLANRSVSLFRRLLSERRSLHRLWRRAEDVSPPEISAEGAAVWETVRRLPRRQAQVIVLTYLEGWSIQEVGEILGCSPFTVKTHLQRAKATLAEQFEEASL